MLSNGRNVKGVVLLMLEAHHRYSYAQSVEKSSTKNTSQIKNGPKEIYEYILFSVIQIASKIIISQF